MNSIFCIMSKYYLLFATRQNRISTLHWNIYISVTSNEGIYVLQWKFYDKLAHTHLSPLDTLTAAATTHVHKAKVMYYYETLNSIDYKGSMTSLQSCQSGFSSISRHSTSGVSSGMSSSHSEKLPRSLAVSMMDHYNGKKWLSERERALPRI